MLTDEQLETESALHEDLTELIPNVLAEAERLMTAAGRPMSFAGEFPDATLGKLIVERVAEGTTLRAVIEGAADGLVNLMTQRLRGYPQNKLDPKGHAERKAKLEAARISKEALREAVRKGLDEDDEEMRAALQQRQQEHRVAVAADLAALMEARNG